MNIPNGKYCMDCKQFHICRNILAMEGDSKVCTNIPATFEDKNCHCSNCYSSRIMILANEFYQHRYWIRFHCEMDYGYSHIVVAEGGR